MEIAICSTIDEPRSNHATWSKWESERHISYHITYRCYLQNDTNKDISTEKHYHIFIKKNYASPTGKVWGLDTLPYYPAIPLLGIYLEKTIIQKYTCTPMFIAALFTIARTWKHPKCPSTEEWVKKNCYLYRWTMS